jgi:hypothetical protein
MKAEAATRNCSSFMSDSPSGAPHPPIPRFRRRSAPLQARIAWIERDDDVGASIYGGFDIMTTSSTVPRYRWRATADFRTLELWRTWWAFTRLILRSLVRRNLRIATVGSSTKDL